MARPDDKEREGIEARKTANQEARDAAAAQEARINTRVEGILNEALNRPKDAEIMPGVPTLVEKLDRAYDLAMVIRAPDAATRAVMAQAKLLGLIVDQQAVLTATAKVEDLTGPIADVRARLVERLSEKVGSSRAEKIAGLLTSRSGDDDEESPEK